ncbi:hypothetical protein PGTUg99_013536 [Puccinia graminis f. sp. tritici]|uniref:Uncharacterized protein n=1 Tax=Puccinia graminis f. sp. tritici TaxID=56615 RepID=A0A5B0R7R2_PUCGR|nr:hypothetical protein PGTUg99_013536 [Puccinia graminis f. sp. tritici]
MDFDDPMFGGDGDPTADYHPDEEDEPPPHSSPCPGSPRHSSLEYSHAESLKRGRQTFEESDDKEDTLRNIDNQSKFSRSQPSTSINMDKVCSALKSSYHLDEEHDKIARKASMCPTPERHANIVYAIIATHQHQTTSHASITYGDTFKNFVRTSARMAFLVPTLDAYSNNPNKAGALPKTLYYICLDAIDKQPEEWREDNLPPEQIKGNSPALKEYTKVMGELLKHQQSHLRVLVLTNILETQRISLKGAVPNRHALVTLIYSDLPPDNQKWTKEQIKTRVEANWLMRIRMAFIRLVLVHYYTHSLSKSTQWGVIDERLAILRKSTAEFQNMHASLVLAKDKELFSHGKEFRQMEKESFTFPSVDDVHAALARKESNVERQASQHTNKCTYVLPATADGAVASVIDGKPTLVVPAKLTQPIDRKRSSSSNAKPAKIVNGKPPKTANGKPRYCCRKPALQPLASQRWSVKPTAGDYAPCYEAHQIFGRGGMGQAHEMLSVKHSSTTTRGVV